MVQSTETTWTPGMLAPMKIEWIELADLDAYIDDDAWVMQQKLDGVRLMARCGNGRVDFVGGGGMHLTHAASALHFDKLREELLPLADMPGGVVLDGELMLPEGRYVIYDLPLMGDMITPDDDFATRREVLENWFGMVGFATVGFQNLELVPQASTPMEKMELFLKVQDAEAEGVVLKRTDARYESDRRVKHQLKVKFVKDADAVVIDRNTNGSMSARLAMWDGEVLRPVGGCSMIGKEDAQIGDVIEVRYLYATESLTLYQPRMIRIRTDKAASDCRIEQLRPVNKAVIR